MPRKTRQKAALKKSELVLEKSKTSESICSVKVSSKAKGKVSKAKGKAVSTTSRTSRKDGAKKRKQQQTDAAAGHVMFGRGASLFDDDDDFFKDPFGDRRSGGRATSDPCRAMNDRMSEMMSSFGGLGNIGNMLEDAGGGRGGRNSSSSQVARHGNPMQGMQMSSIIYTFFALTQPLQLLHTAVITQYNYYVQSINK
jgi:hypothetical protein